MVKKGDTLIEVVLAVGIFSLVAVGITAVMNGGTSSAQSALEITLAREEIDVQAESLRFIQSAYIADKDATVQDVSNPQNNASNGRTNHFANLWKLIKNNAVTDLGQGDSSAEEKLLSFSPATCDELYGPDGEVHNYNAFILNPRKLGEDPGAANDTSGNNSAYVSASYTNTNQGTFRITETYPRILYNNNGDEGNLVDDENRDNEQSISAAEGIYIIAVADASNTTIVDKSKENPEYAFYDFYIRSCWYGSDADHPSTISTVIRLYNPDAIDDKKESGQ